MRLQLPDTVILRNILFVYILQGTNFLLAFLTAPYLARALGVAGYGALSYCMSANAFVWIVVDWGYGVGAVRAVAMARSDPAALKITFWQGLSGRALLALPAMALVLALAVLSRANPPWVVIVSGLLSVMGAVLACDWFVQGIERMGIYLVTSVLSRIAGFGLMLLLVHRPEDASTGAVIHGLTGLFTGLSGLVAAWALCRMGMPKLYLRAGARQVWAFRHYFVARSNALLYATAAPVVLGMAASAHALGTFAGADKIVRICIVAVVPLSIALQARVNALMVSSRSQASSISARVFLLHVAVTVPMSLVLLFFADHISDFVLGRDFRSSADIIRLLSPVPVLMGLSGSLSGQFLVPLGRARALSRVTLVSSLLYLATILVLGRTAGAAGAAVSFLVAELCLVLGFVTILLRTERSYLMMALGSLKSGGRRDGER